MATATKERRKPAAQVDDALAAAQAANAAEAARTADAPPELPVSGSSAKVSEHQQARELVEEALRKAGSAGITTAQLAEQTGLDTERVRYVLWRLPRMWGVPLNDRREGAVKFWFVP
jgi:hypothetical protein